MAPGKGTPPGPEEGSGLFHRQTVRRDVFHHIAEHVQLPFQRVDVWRDADAAEVVVDIGVVKIL